MNCGRNQARHVEPRCALERVGEHFVLGILECTQHIGDMRGSKLMCLIAFLPMADVGPRYPLGKYLNRLVTVVAVKCEDCASPAAMLLMTSGFVSTVGPCATATIT
jgi:hypothetical protein